MLIRAWEQYTPASTVQLTSGAIQRGLVPTRLLLVPPSSDTQSLDKLKSETWGQGSQQLQSMQSMGMQCAERNARTSYARSYAFRSTGISAH